MAEKVRLDPYLNFNGETRAAMEFYHGVLGGELQLQTFADQDPNAPEEQRDKILHARLEAEDFTIMASDPMPGQRLEVGENVSLSLQGSDREKLTRFFDGLAEGGQVGMPLAEQFWGDTFGMLVDRFGVHWMVNITKEA